MLEAHHGLGSSCRDEALGTALFAAIVDAAGVTDRVEAGAEHRSPPEYDVRNTQRWESTIRIGAADSR